MNWFARPTVDGIVKSLNTIVDQLNQHREAMLFESTKQKELANKHVALCMDATAEACRASEVATKIAELLK
jgi:hypothetical protein